MNALPVIGPAEVQDVLGKWWWNYDEGHFDVLADLLTEDVHFTCRTDTDAVAWAEFARADMNGRDTVMYWQTEHRRASPYPSNRQPETSVARRFAVWGASDRCPAPVKMWRRLP